MAAACGSSGPCDEASVAAVLGSLEALPRELRSKVEQLVESFGAGGPEAASRLEAVLEYGFDVVESLMLATPRRQRGGLQQLATQIEAAVEACATAEWCTGLAGCDEGALRDLCTCLCAVEGLPKDGIGAVAALERALDQLDLCGDVAVRGLQLLGSPESQDS